MSCRIIRIRVSWMNFLLTTRHVNAGVSGRWTKEARSEFFERPVHLVLNGHAFNAEFS